MLNQHRVPRFSQEFREANLALVDTVQQVAQQKDAPQPRSLWHGYWLKKPWIVPIPGPAKLHRLKENLGDVEVSFTEQEMTNLNEATSTVQFKGERVPEQMLE